ncbi:MAG: hypothetical protein WDN28_25690 [Chthoniobacter sp.]
MNFFDARAISKTGQYHVRRVTWPTDQWFMYWRGVWFYFAAEEVRPVRASDYSKDDLNAADWTTVPAALASCPITGPGGGGAPPAPGSPGFPSGGITAFPGLPGEPDGGGGGGSGGGGDSLPPPDDVGTLTVLFSGVVGADSSPTHPNYSDWVTGGGINGSYTLEKDGDGSWSGFFTFGVYDDQTGFPGHQFDVEGEITVTKDSFGAYTVGAATNLFVGGGFNTAVALLRGQPISNTFTHEGGGFYHDGTATVQ